MFWVFRVKNHDFTQKKILFLTILGGAHAGCAPPGSTPAVYKMYIYKALFFCEQFFYLIFIVYPMPLPDTLIVYMHFYIFKIVFLS